MSLIRLKQKKYQLQNSEWLNLKPIQVCKIANLLIIEKMEEELKYITLNIGEFWKREKEEEKKPNISMATDLFITGECSLSSINRVDTQCLP